MKGLIFYNGKLHERAGGPSSYLYNLKTGLENLKFYDISFLTLENFPNIKSNTQEFLRNGLLSLGNLFPKSVAYLYTYFRTKLKAGVLKKFDENFDFIHFHRSSDFIQLRETNTKFKILTTHSPIPPHLEIEDYVANKYNSKLSIFFKEVEKRTDINAFSNADILMFPSPESLEGYFETWPEFQDIIKDKRILFVPSGALPLQAKEKPDVIRKKFNIPFNALVVSYVGRHHLIKGYDVLQKAASYLWNRNINVYFLITGIEWPLKGLNDRRWIEVGWTDDPGSYINASDIFVLPNRKTLFDLVLIEVLSLGKPIIASNVGGNKFFAKQSEGVILFQNGDHINLAEKILELYEYREHLNEMGYKNLQLYLNFYTPEKFALRYIQSLTELLHG
jgi:glycosyltransferase involved in cell wall biosynthesis